MSIKKLLWGGVLALFAGATLLPAQAQTPGTCSLGSAVADLDINNVRARLYNNGGLFWKGAGNVYNVPKVPAGQPITPNAIFASGIWMGGKVGGELRQAAATYGDWELWPGPLGENGQLLDPNCSNYDRIFVVSNQQIRDYLATGTPAPDLADWPTGLGAPTFVDVDGDGRFGFDDLNNNFIRDAGEPTEPIVVPTSRAQKVNLNASPKELPLITGDQMAWWIMNDVGSQHKRTGSKPIGLEVQTSAFSFNREGALGNTTFYRYKLTYRGTQPFTDAWFGVFSDPDLGNATDDYVGSDTTLGIAYTYNADNFDEGSDGYGAQPPAIAYDFFQGPLVPAIGETFTDPDGTVHQDQTRLPATRFVYYNNGAGNNGDPRGNTDDYYKFLQGLWQDGTPMRDCGDGEGEPTCGIARFMWPGDPVTGTGWSERNLYPNEPGPRQANPPNDRRFAFSTGPFTINPGDVQEIVFGIVWAKGANNLASVSAVKRADQIAQLAFDNNFVLPPTPDAPTVSVAELDKQVILSWEYGPNSNNFREKYRAPLAITGQTTFYNFEGFRIYQYPNETFSSDEAELVATYDRANDVLLITELDDNGLPAIVAEGGDTGTEYSISFENLTNYKQYYYGVQAYAFNPETQVERVLSSPMVKVIATPAPIDSYAGGSIVDETNYREVLVGEAQPGTKGQGTIRAQIENPLALKNDTYAVEFYNYPTKVAGRDTTLLTYDLVRQSDGKKLLDGKAFADANGAALPQGENVVVVDGLRFTIMGPAGAGFVNFLTVANANGPIDPPEYAAFAFNSSGFPHPTTEDRPDGTRQQSSGLPAGNGWGIFTFGDRSTYDQWFSRATRDGGNFSVIGENDFEWRFGGTSIAHAGFSDPAYDVTVPFEIWNIGVGTPDDPSDDFRMIPYICESDCGAGGTDGVFDIGGDSPLSGGANDPISDAIYWYNPVDTSPGQAGYNAYANGGTPDLTARGPEVLARIVLMGWNFGTDSYPQTRPEDGTVFRIITAKVNQPGDKYLVKTTDYAPQIGVDSVEVATVDQINIVPNPYRGASAYETSNLLDKARFVNLPDRATIRVFTLSGTLIKTIEKSGPERYLDWNLETDSNLPIASGMYLIHIQVPTAQGTQEKVLKFGVVKKRIQLDIL